MSRFAVVACAAALIASVAILGHTSRSSPLEQFPPRITVAPKAAKVFRGDSLRFRTSVRGGPQEYAIHWSLVGPGSIDASGLYRSAAGAQATADVVASAGIGVADSANVQTVAPPPLTKSLALVSCYEDGTIDVHDARDLSQLGAFSVVGRAAGIAVDSVAHRAVFALESQLVAVDLASMRWRASAPRKGVRFSEVALLAWGYAAATDNNADAGRPGVRIFRINRAGVPVLVSSVAAGETPEGIVSADHGRSFFVSNINSNSVMRFALDYHGQAKLTGKAQTGARPFGLAVDPVHQLLFVADNDTATISGAKSRPGLEHFSLPGLRRVGSILSTGSKASLPLGVVVDVASARLFVTNEGDGNVAVLSIPTLRRIATLPTGLTPWLPAFDPLRHRLYVPNARSHTVSVYDSVALRAVSPDVPTCAYPTSIAIFTTKSKPRGR